MSADQAATIPVPHPGLEFCQVAERNVTELGKWLKGEEHKSVAADAALAIRTLLTAIEVPLEAAEINHVLTGSPKPDFEDLDLDPPVRDPVVKPVRQVRMWLVEHEWKPRQGAARGAGATSYHDASHTTEAYVDSEVTRLMALPDVAWVKKTPLYADPVDATVPDFTGLARRKLDGLLDRGWQINGYSIIKDGDLGLVTADAFVGWFSVAERNAQVAQVALDAAKSQNALEVSRLIELVQTAKRLVALVQSRPVGLASGTAKPDPFGIAFGALDGVIQALAATSLSSRQQHQEPQYDRPDHHETDGSGVLQPFGSEPEAETYYDKSQDGPWYEALADQEFAWELIKAAQDLNDTGLGDDLDKWMPFQVMIADAGGRIQRLIKAEANLPEGWMAVPLEITEEMKQAAMEILLHRGDIYAREDGSIVIETITPSDLWTEFLRVVAAAPGPVIKLGPTEKGITR